jgi:hypothetical protein
MALILVSLGVFIGITVDEDSAASSGYLVIYSITLIFLVL